MLVEVIVRQGVFGSKICWVRDSRDLRDLGLAVLRELLYPLCESSLVTKPPGSSPGCHASSSGRINSHFKYCSVMSILVFLPMATPKSLSIETAPSPADGTFTKAWNADSPELRATTPYAMLVEHSMWEP